MYMYIYIEDRHNKYFSKAEVLIIFCALKECLKYIIFLEKGVFCSFLNYDVANI